MSAAIEVRGLGWRAPGFALRGVDLTVPAGAVYGFLGPNGAGKSTTIRLLLGLERPEAGDIRLLGEPVPDALPRILGRTGYVPERPHLYHHLTVGEALDYHAAFFERWDPSRADRLRREFALREASPLRTLSKGELGKLMLLLALAQQPDLLILDEPTDGLDPVARRDLLAALLAYVEERGATVFLSSHLIHELERFADWVGVLDGGRMVAELRMEEFRRGIKRLRVPRPAAAPDAPPCPVLLREPDPLGGEAWLVRGWEAAHAAWFAEHGIAVREVGDLDLEEAFVELLRATRAARALTPSPA